MKIQCHYHVFFWPKKPIFKTTRGSNCKNSKISILRSLYSKWIIGTRLLKKNLGGVEFLKPTGTLMYQWSPFLTIGFCFQNQQGVKTGKTSKFRFLNGLISIWKNGDWFLPKSLGGVEFRKSVENTMLLWCLFLTKETCFQNHPGVKLQKQQNFDS